MTITHIGPHAVKHGSVMAGIDDLMAGTKAYLAYSDPPWGQGNLNYWQTINNKHTGAPRQEIDLDAFLDTIFDTLQRHVEGVVLVEYGQRWRDPLLARAARYGLAHSGEVELLYKSGSKLLPCDLHVFGTGGQAVPLPEGFLETVRHTFGYDTLRKAFTPFAKPGAVVLDPCCGMGYTAQAALDTGMVFRGNELNAKRLEKTIARLRKGALVT
jgi:hypothetical protein